MKKLIALLAVLTMLTPSALMPSEVNAISRPVSVTVDNQNVKEKQISVGVLQFIPRSWHILNFSFVWVLCLKLKNRVRLVQRQNSLDVGRNVYR